MGLGYRVVMTENQLPLYRRRLPKKADLVVRKSAFDIEALAKAAAPVRTGHLKNSIQATPRNIGGAAGSTNLYWEVNVGADYGIYVEYGTRYMGAQPYLGPAVERVAPTYRRAMAHILGVF
jgi:HK97 gp10 family phage protein